MSQISIQPYEISIWEDELFTPEGSSESYYKENKIAVIGSDTMTAPSRAQNPTLTKNINGETKLTFDLVHKYYDVEVGAEVENPFCRYLVSERKVKLYYQDEWYDFIIKNCVESSENNTFSYEADSLFINELGKVGYNIVLSADLSNNQGTILELANKAVEGTDWVIDEDNSDIIQQFVAEPLYTYTCNSSFSARDITNNSPTPITIGSEEKIYIFYSVIANQQTQNVQFLRDSEYNKSLIDSNNVIKMTNYMLNDDITFNGSDIKINDTIILTLDTSETTTGINEKFEGYRLAYNQRTKYDTVNERPVSLYTATYGDGEEKTIYKYTDYEYTSSTLLSSFITNGSGFNIYSTGTLEGWSNLTQTEETNGEVVLQPLELVTYPSISKESLIDLSTITSIRGFLKTKFKGTLTSNYKNTIFNDGFNDYATTIGSLSKGEKYVFRISYGISDNDLPKAEENCSIKAIIAGYTTVPVDAKETDDENVTSKYLYEINPNEILFEFNDGFTIKNNEITTGVFKADDYSAYYVDGVSVAPALNTCYTEITYSDTGEELTRDTRIWDTQTKTYVPKESKEDFLDYFYSVAECKQSLSNTELTDTTKKYGIFLYTDNNELISSGKDIFLYEVQLFKYREESEGVPLLIGSIPNATAISTDYYYIEPEEGTSANDIITFSTIDALAEYLSISVDNIKANYNENYEKISSIDISRSNVFNIIQELCEAFECWAKFTIDHNENGSVKLDANGAPSKRISFHNFIGKDNFAGFKYGINLNSIQRTIDSNEFVSKLIVEQVQNDSVEGGTVSIGLAPSNPTGESYILNFSYYLNQGLIDNPDDFRNDYNEFIEKLKDANNRYQVANAQKQLAEISRIKINANVTVYSELISEAQEDYTKSQEDFKKLTGLNYTDYISNNEFGINFDVTNNSVIVKYANELKDIPFNFYDSDGNELLQDGDPVESTENGVFTRTYKIDGMGEDESQTTKVVIAFHGDSIEEEEPGYYSYTYDGLTSEEIEQYNEGTLKLYLDYTGRAIIDAWLTIENNVAKIVYYAPEYEATQITLVKSYSNITDLRDELFYIAVTGRLVNYQYVASDVAPTVFKYSDFATGTTIRDAVPTLIWKWQKEADDSNDIVAVQGSGGLPFSTTKDNETLIELIGKIVDDQIIINDYTPLLEAAKKEKAAFDAKIDGSKTYTMTIVTSSVTEDNNTINSTKEIVSDYIEGLSFKLSNDNGSYDCETSFTKRIFSQDELYTKLTFLTYPEGYQLQYKKDGKTYTSSKPYIINLLENSSRTISLVPIVEVKGISSEMEDILEEKEGYEEDFYRKYSRFIQEGTWTSQDYIDHELYYLDAMQVSATSAQPKVTYDLQVAEISELPGFQNYTFDVGDKTYIEDTQFFGYKYERVDEEDSSSDIIATPVREEVVVSEVTWKLDSPEENSITIQNYRTQFADLFQRISAAVQSVEYNAASYSRAASILDSGGFINSSLLTQSLTNLMDGYSLTANGSVVATNDGLITLNPQEPVKRLRLGASGLKTSTDNGESWSTIITADGISTNALTAGTIDTQQIQILDGSSTSFRWDKYGLNAYGFGNDSYDLKTYVRFDKYGIYGIKNAEDFKASSLDDIKDSAHFGLTWDGFFIKNSYTDGYVSISSDNDFQVIQTIDGVDQEKIKIGALEFDSQGNPTKYGINIRDNEGNVVFTTGDDGDLIITGTINAAAGNIGGMAVNGTTLTMNHTVFEKGVGIYSDIETEDGSPMFIISDEDGTAIFEDITARGHIDATSGTLSNLSVLNYITVGQDNAAGSIKSVNYVTGTSGWAINSDGSAEFSDIIARGHIEANTGTLGNLDVIDTITVGADGAIESANYSSEDGWHIDNSLAVFNNARVRGEINAGSGNFYGTVTVGQDSSDDTKPYIVIDGLNSKIKSSNYQDGAGYGWMINSEGDAYFNNITARGAIKTAVFEYAEIQAVGGIFIFRPSSTIRTAEISGDDLIITVEKFLLFRDGDWCKVSNYISDGTEPDATVVNNILLTNGLTHVYEISLDTENHTITLIGGKNFVDSVKQTGQTDDDVLQSLVGGALVDMGNQSNGSGSVGTNNYGIGINSSDNTVNLPARAISLFETIIDETHDPKVTYKYRGILGTLPELSSTDVSDSIYNTNMAGTQGIYTDNMYIGDANKYIAYFTNERTNQRELRINGANIVFTYSDGSEQTIDEKIDGKIEEIEIEGGIKGEDAAILTIDSSEGNVFRDNSGETDLTVTIFYGSSVIVNQTQLTTSFGVSAYLEWEYKNNTNDWVTLLSSDPRIDDDGFTIHLDATDVYNKANFRCKLVV